MITNDPEFKELVTGLDELFAVIDVKDGYSFHDAELENFSWNVGEDILIKFSVMWHEKNYYMTWQITPDLADFTFYGAPYNPYVNEITIRQARTKRTPAVLNFYCEGCGLDVDFTAAKVEIHEIPKGDYRKYQ